MQEDDESSRSANDNIKKLIENKDVTNDKEKTNLSDLETNESSTSADKRPSPPKSLNQRDSIRRLTENCCVSNQKKLLNDKLDGKETPTKSSGIKEEDEPLQSSLKPRDSLIRLAKSGYVSNTTTIFSKDQQIDKTKETSATSPKPIKDKVGTFENGGRRKITTVEKRIGKLELDETTDNTVVGPSTPVTDTVDKFQKIKDAPLSTIQQRKLELEGKDGHHYNNNKRKEEIKVESPSEVQFKIDKFNKNEKKLTEVRRRKLELEEKEREAKIAADQTTAMKTTWKVNGSSQGQMYRKQLAHGKVYEVKRI